MKHTYLKAALAAFFYFRVVRAACQPGLSDFYRVENQVHHYYFGFSDFALAIGAVCGLIGGLRVYNNWQLGKPHIDAQVAAWFFSCLFLSLLSTCVAALFGIN